MSGGRWTTSLPGVSCHQAGRAPVRGPVRRRRREPRRCENMRCLELALDDIQAIVFGHVHFDPTAGLHGLLRALERPGLLVVIHPDFWPRRRPVLASPDPLELPATSRRASGSPIRRRRGTQGELPAGRVAAHDRRGRQDDWLRAGLPRPGAARSPRVRARPPGARRPGAVSPYPRLGPRGRHRMGPRRRRQYPPPGDAAHRRRPAMRRRRGLPPEPPALRAADRNGVRRPAETMGPEDVVVPTHCTGWEARVALAGAFCDAFPPNTVGSRLEL
jgi:7,8-dihydropterin-6-yl-methyl-4-(beta-D-ribofuranosyl)aminobenzene 5'-phosphate synthase